MTGSLLSEVAISIFQKDGRQKEKALEHLEGGLIDPERGSWGMKGREGKCLKTPDERCTCQARRLGSEGVGKTCPLFF